MNRAAYSAVLDQGLVDESPAYTEVVDFKVSSVF
jgi:hypothetical protein